MALSLAEIIVALGILALVLLSLVSVLVSSLKSEKKAFLMTSALNLADSELERLFLSVKSDQPLGARAEFWGRDYPSSGAPLRQGTATVSHTEFHFEITTATVMAADGLPIGDPDHRLKEVDILVRWYPSSTASLGQGESSYRQKRLFSEINLDSGDQG